MRKQMKLNREQIVKALECCSVNEGCADCHYWENFKCINFLLRDALALIRELTEENERLQGALKAEERHNELAMECAKKALDNAKSDTVRKMQEEAREMCFIVGDEEYVTLHDLDQIAKELLEEVNDG